MNKATEFSSSDGDIIDFRFSSSQISAFFKTNGELDSLLPNRRYHVPVGFNGIFDTKLKKILENLVDISFSEAESHNLRLEYTDPAVEIFTLNKWKQQYSERKGVPHLPAARILSRTGNPVIELIIPEKISTSEEAIKIARLLFSKLFGKLFFDERIPKKEAFRNRSGKDSAFEFDLTEKAKFCFFFGDHTQEENALFTKLGKKARVVPNKSHEYGKKEFYNLFCQVPPVASLDDSKILDANFRRHVEFFKIDSKRFYNQLTQKIFEALPQAAVIVPYDQLKIDQLRKTGQWTVFHAISERSRIGMAAIDQLRDCFDHLNEIDLKSPADYQTLDLWLSALNQRIISLVKKGFTKPFLTDHAILSDKQKLERAQFPLWVWKNKLYQIDGKPKDIEKSVKRIISRYTNSTFQKAFELSLYLQRCLKLAEGESRNELKSSPEYTKSRSLLTALELRRPFIESIHYTCLVGSQLATVVNDKPVDAIKAYGTFEAGWSYFVSYALVHQYFKTIARKSGKPDTKSEQFHQLIKKFAQARISQQAPFQISWLLIKIYESVEFDLKAVIRLITEESHSLDFFVLNQPLLFRSESKPVDAVIEDYAGKLKNWLDKER